MANHNPPTNGFDKRRHQINRSGRPKSFDELRNLAQGMANEVATDKDGNPIIIGGHEEIDADGITVIVGGHKATNSEMILRTWMKSKDARLQQAFVAYSWGKPPDIVQGDHEGGPIILKVIYDTKKPPDEDEA